MEHSLLHGLQLTGLVVVLGGSLFVLGLLRPACRRLGSEPAREALAGALSAGGAHLVSIGAVTAALATFLDLFVQVADIQGQTVLAGVELALVGRFASRTTMGQLALARIACLVLAAAATRLPDPQRWSAIGVLGAGALWCTCLTGHAAAQSTARISAIASQLTHVGACAAWIGVLVHLLMARSLMVAQSRPPCLLLIAEITRRVAPIAGMAASLLIISGVYGAVRNLHSPAELVISPYGLLLLVKLVMVIPVLAAGVINHYVVRPNLLRLARTANLTPDEAIAWLARFGKMLEIEVTAGLLVLTLAGILGSVSPPGEDGSLQLTRVQLEALLTPSLPRTTLVDPSRSL